tara:strand:- start:54 stop:569 length:516 start_codon:yes stop_codon:yes gene_type:complete
VEFFHEINQEKFLWVGFNKKQGWVILDRLLPANKSGHRSGDLLYFIKCSDWTIYTEQKSKWEFPEYIFVVTYLESSSEKKQKEIEIKNLIYEFNKNKREEIKKRYIETIHYSYLKKKGSVSSTISKFSRGRRQNHCWKCLNSVDNAFDYECKYCRWIICSNCGACKMYGCI